MEALLDEVELALVEEIVVLPAECVLGLLRPDDDVEVTWSVAFPQFVVGRHLFVCHRLVVPVVFPACPLCGSIAAPF